MCEHYDRKCSLKCNQCNDFYSCRICHDEKQTHVFDRYNVVEIKCSECNFIQKPSCECTECHITFAKYFCNICNLYDNNGDTKGIWHCDGCNLCRVGGKENYFHCDTCKCCISIKNTEHVCLTNILNNNCPICTEDMFSSRIPSTMLRCGHYLHSDCYKQLINQPNIPRCPTCSKSCMDLTEYWNYLDEEIRKTPLPDELVKKLNIVCCDCNTISETDFHIIGLKCKNCSSYNTKKM